MGNYIRPPNELLIEPSPRGRSTWRRWPSRKLVSHHALPYTRVGVVAREGEKGVSMGCLCLYLGGWMDGIIWSHPCVCWRRKVVAETSSENLLEVALEQRVLNRT